MEYLFEILFVRFSFADFEVITSTFLLVLIYYFKDIRRNYQIYSSNKITKYLFIIFKSILIAISIMFIVNYFRVNWLYPIIDKANESKNTVAVILTFIGILITILSAIAIFEFNRIHEYFLKNTKDILENMRKDNKDQAKNIAKKCLRKVERNIDASDIRIRINQLLFQNYLKAATLKDQIAIQKTRLLPEILPIFSTFKENSRERHKINEAFHVLKHCPVPILPPDDNAWEYIENEIAPKFKDDTELHQLILDVIKRRK